MAEPGGINTILHAQEDIEPDHLRETMGIAAPVCGSHFIIQLLGQRHPQTQPCGDQLPTQRAGLLVGPLRHEGGRTCHIYRMERIKLCAPLWPAQISWPHQVQMLQIAHPGSVQCGIGLSAAVGASGIAYTRGEP